MIDGRLLELLRCPRCGLELKFKSTAASALACDGCGSSYPIVDGIPRFVDVPEDERARRTQASFGYEWTHFNDWRPSGATNFNDYFQNFDLSALECKIVLDAGCGMGRHARHVAPYAGRLVALDFSRAIDQAARNTLDLPSVSCVQADLLSLPLAESSFDFVYSLGVLHHIEGTEDALRNLVSVLKPGGRLRIYLYWKRHGWKGRLLAAVTTARRVTTRIPFPVLRACSGILSAALFGAVVLPYRALTAAGVKAIEDLPLFAYSKYPFNVLYNDQFDRFSAPIEKRYDHPEVVALLQRAGLVDIEVRSCFGWLGDGTKPV